MSDQPKFLRRVQNGKVVYVPQPSASGALKPRAHPPARRSVRRPRQPLTLTFGPWLATGLLLSVGTALAAIIWLSWLALSNPDAAFWLSRFLPSSEATDTPQADQPRTLEQIQRHLNTADRLPGTPIILTADFSLRSPLKAANDFLIPISSQSCKGSPCPKLAELRVYRSLKLPYPLRLFQGERYYHLLDRVTVEGPTEAELIKLVQHSDLVSRSYSLPLTNLQQYTSAPQSGAWLRLSGLKTSGSSTSAYGQVFYFHPEKGYLGLMLNWASPKGAFPVWQQVIEGGEPELLIDQSVGLEPQFAVYQVQAAPTGTLQLRPIQLSQPAFKHPVYTQSLALARQGLWKPALNLLLTVKKAQPQKWSPQAQAQLTLIERHAQVTEARARESSASPMQRILAYTVNGSWQGALTVFEDQKTRPEDVRAMLRSDAGRLKGRINATLAVQPRQKDAIAWGAMLTHVQRGPSAAIAWTRQKAPGDQALLKKVQTLLERLETRSIPQTPSPFDAAKRKPQPAAPAPPQAERSPLPKAVPKQDAVPETLPLESAPSPGVNDSNEPNPADDGTSETLSDPPEKLSRPAEPVAL
ncbi:MAG: hypothetical protein AAF329_18245 [Cyanobacteria bacterium P01_A01_bin.17]